MKQKKLRDIKPGEIFKLSPSETAPLWVKMFYDRQSKTFSCYKYEDVNHETFMNGNRNVYTNF